MGYFEDKEHEELNQLYPPGSRERQVLDYSQAEHSDQMRGEVHPTLLMAFKLLMGISILVAVITLVAYLNTPH